MTATQPWRAVGIRLKGETAWTALGPAPKPDAVPAMEAARHIRSRIRPDGKREVLEVRDAR